MRFKKILAEMSGDIDRQLASTIIPLIKSSKVILVIDGTEFKVDTDPESIKSFIDSHDKINVDTNTRGIVKLILKTIK